MSEKAKVKGLSDRIAIKGYITIWQGEGEEKKLICRRKENHWVDGGIQGLISALIGQYIRSYYSGNVQVFYWSNNPNIYLGTDTAAPTTHSMTALTSPIGAPPGTAPDTIFGANLTNPSAGTFKIDITAQWVAGTISGTVGELALYLGAFTDLSPNWVKDTPGGSYTYPVIMVSRLSAADTDFSSFVIDETKSLTVQWDLEVSFA